MVRPAVVFGGALVLVWATMVVAQDPPDIEPEEVAEVLTELEEAGAPATAVEIAEFVSAASSGPSRGVLLGRTGWTDTGGLDHTVRLRLSRDWLTVRSRWRQYRDGAAEATGAVMVGSGGWKLAAGRLGLAHGFGLLVGAPGRGLSLTADGHLAGRRARLVPWSGSAVTQTILGAGLAVQRGQMALRGLVGHREASGEAGQLTAVGQVAVIRESWQTTALLVSDPAETGVSLGGHFGDGVLAGSFEGTWRRPTGARQVIQAYLVQGRWQPHRVLRLEILAGSADLGPRPVMGQKHPVMGDWAGRGVALRGTWRAAGGMGVKLLVQRSRGRQDVSSGSRRLRTLADALVTRSWTGGWQGQARWREGAEEVSTWSERFPWQPPALSWWDSRRVLSVKAGWRGGRGRSQLLWRRLTLARTRQDTGLESGGSRDLATLSGGWALGSVAYLRAVWTLSWGDPVDLVSAVVPFRGYVLPRHWGHWRSERLVGVELERGPWKFRAALSWRQAAGQDVAAESADNLASWLEGAWSW